MKPSPTDKVYPVARIAPILRSLEDEGVAASDALRRSISPSQSRSPATRVSLNQIIECYRNAIRLSLDPFFAYHTGLRFHVSSFGMYGFAILSSTDFRQASRFAEQYQQLAFSTVDIRFKEETDYAVWTIEPAPLPSVDATLYKFIVEMQFGIATSLHRDVIAPSFAPRELHVTYESVAETKSYAAVFGCPVRFRQKKNAFVLDKHWLDGPAKLGNELTYLELIKICDWLLDQMQLRVGIAGSIREAFLINLAQPTTLDAIARRLKLSKGTLKRRLREDGTSYRKVVDELKTQLAIKYLRDTDLTVEDIASSLGFSDATNFRHAFRRWTKKTPGEFRRPSKSSQRFVA